MTQRYNFKNIRNLLIEGFTDTELRRLCYDIPVLKPVYNELLSDETSKAKTVDRLIEYADKKLQVETLLNQVKEYNPAMYEQHQPYITDTEPVDTNKILKGKSLWLWAVIGVVALGVVMIAVTIFLYRTSPALFSGPFSGELKHNPEDPYIESRGFDINLSNFVVEGKFLNPYSTEDHLWDIGINFRFNSEGYYRLAIASDNVWNYGYFDRERKWHGVSSGTVDNLVPDKGASNWLKVIAYEKKGCLYINNKFIAELDLSALILPGDIEVIIGDRPGTEKAGATTRYEEFNIYRLDSLSCP
ncbi:MAG: hypothetical protein L6R45_34795 [Anaerolineae bacterium]|nr:hypothetical protein [Anaerolineae bacterium]